MWETIRLAVVTSQLSIAPSIMSPFYISDKSDVIQFFQFLTLTYPRELQTNTFTVERKRGVPYFRNTILFPGKRENGQLFAEKNCQILSHLLAVP